MFLDKYFLAVSISLFRIEWIGVFDQEGLIVFDKSYVTESEQTNQINCCTFWIGWLKLVWWTNGLMHLCNKVAFRNYYLLYFKTYILPQFKQPWNQN